MQIDHIYKRKWVYLNDLCDALTLLAKDILGIKTRYVRDSENEIPSVVLKKVDMLIHSIKRAVNADSYKRIIYLPRNYPIPNDFYLKQRSPGEEITEIEKFKLANIEVQTYNFHHPAYKQYQNKRGGSFVPNLSVFDLIFNCGEESLSVLKSGGDDKYINE